MRAVHFHFRPELSIKVILKCIVPRIRAANLGLVARRQSHAQRALDVESSEALPIGDRGCDDRVGRPILILAREQRDRKSTRLNSSHLVISYAVFCLKKKKKKKKVSTERVIDIIVDLAE